MLVPISVGVAFLGRLANLTWRLADKPHDIRSPGALRLARARQPSFLPFQPVIYA